MTTDAAVTPPLCHPDEKGMEMAHEESRAQQLVGDLAPELAQLTDEVLFADVWQRPGLSQRERSLVTVAVLDGR